MKKFLAITLSMLLVLCACPFGVFAAEKTIDAPASAYAPYERGMVSSNNAEYISSLNYDQIAGVILDWVDRQIAAKAADFNTFEVEVLGQEISVNLDVTSIDGIMKYAGYLTQLGGDFANLDVTALNGLSRQGGDINFIFGMLQFMADNAATFGKVFHWEAEGVFDYGKVGEYIETLPEDNEIRIFYNDYLIGNDIQEKFIAEIAREMGYTVAKDEAGERTETFDEIISKGIIAKVAEFCEANGLLSEAGLATLEAYDLRTSTIYDHIKNFAALLQSDNQVKLDTYLSYLLDTVVRTALKVMFGNTATVGEEVADATAVKAEFNARYADLAYLYTISGGTVYFKAADGSYYQFTVTAEGTISSVKALTWENTFGINFEPPVVNVYTGATGEADKTLGGYDCDLVQEYRPSQDYKFEVYSPYGDVLTSAGVEIAGSVVPETYAPVMVEENAKTMKDLFGLEVTGLTEPVETVITFSAIQAYAETTAEDLAKDFAGDKATINDVVVELTYAGYATEDEFVCEVNATATVDATENVSGFGLNFPIDASGFIQNPIATIVLDNLSGGLGVDSALELMNMIDSDFVVDMDLLDFTANYDAYNGVIGQVNRVFCDLIDMLVTDEAYAQFGLAEGSNANLTDNITKLCTKLDEVFALAKQFMDEAGFESLVANSGVNNLFASSHGFNANMIYNLDFSNPESLYVCLIEMVLDFIDKEEPGSLINDIHNAVEGLETLDAIAVALTDYALGKVIPEANTKFAAQGLNLTVPAATDAKTVADKGAKDIIMSKLVDVAYEAAVWGVGFVNSTINDIIDQFNTESGFGIGHVSFKLGVEKAATWQDTLAGLVNRVYELADGIIIVCGTYEGTDTFDKISAVVNAMLPMGSMFSNCAGNGFTCDLNTILNTYIFGECLDGDFDNFLRLFETEVKTNDVAEGVSVTYALIKASDHIVDAIFPNTVEAETYTESLTVQEEFTSGDSDVLIAKRNMISINNRKTHLVPAALDLVRESGLLPYFAACEHLGTTSTVPGVPATCTTEGYTDKEVCDECGYTISGGTVIAKNDNHTDVVDVAAVAATCSKAGNTAGQKCNACNKIISGVQTIAKNDNHVNTTTIAAVAATCTTDGKTAGVKCNDCNKIISGCEVIAKTGHTDVAGDGICDTCNENLNPQEEEKPQNFFQKIIAFFNRIIDWFKNLFK